MEIVKQWSWPTLVLYVGLAILIAFLFRQSIVAKKNKKEIKIFKFKLNVKYIYYFLICAIFILFASFRYYNAEIGGTDTVVYESFFTTIEFIPFSLKTIFTFEGYEFLYYNFMSLIKVIGGNFFAFSLAIYSLLVLAYIYVVDKAICDEKKWFWLILAFLPLLKSLNIIRNCFAAAIGFVAIEGLNRNKYITFVILSIVAFLNHYVAIILLALGLFCWIIPEKWITKKKILIPLNVACIAIAFVALPIAKIILKNTGFGIYLDNVEISLFGYIPIIFAYILMIWDKEIVNYLKEIKHFVYYKVMVFISFALPVFILIGGASRMLLLFELPRFILYSDLYAFYRKKIPAKLKILYDIACIGGVVLWFVFRIWRIWDGYGLMPYYNTLFM